MVINKLTNKHLHINFLQHTFAMLLSNAPLGGDNAIATGNGMFPNLFTIVVDDYS